MLRLVSMHWQADNEQHRLPLCDQFFDTAEAVRGFLGINRRKRMCQTQFLAAYGYPNAFPSEIKGKDGPAAVILSMTIIARQDILSFDYMRRLRVARRIFSQQWPASLDRLEKSIPSRRVAADRRSSHGRSNMMLGKAGTVSQAFWDSSCSIWPGAHPE